MYRGLSTVREAVKKDDCTLLAQTDKLAGCSSRKTSLENISR